MVTRCIDTPTLNGMAIEVFEGQVAGGSCPDSLDAGDTVKIFDEYFNIVYDSSSDSFDAFYDYVQESKAHSGDPLIRNVNGREFVYNDGQLVSFNENCTSEIQAEQRNFTCTREDGYVELFSIRKKDGRWWLQQNVRSPDGVTLRSRDLCFSSRVDQIPQGNFVTSWQIGGSEFLRMGDPWKYELVNGKLTRAITFQNRDVDSFIEAESGFGGVAAVDYTYIDPEGRRDFYYGVDRFLGSQDISIDTANQSIEINGKSFRVITAGNSPRDSGEIERELVGIVDIEGLINLLSGTNIRIFMGSITELRSLAEQYGLPPFCLIGIEEFTGLNCGRYGIIFIKTAVEDFPRMQKILVHELAHSILDDTEGLYPAFKKVYLDYVYTTLIRAGIQSENDLRFLMEIASGRRGLVTDLDKTALATFNKLWHEYSLDQYFPTQYSFSNASEFFCEIVATYMPYNMGSSEKMYYQRFHYALKKLGEEGVDSFLAEIKTQFPDLIQYNGSLTDNDNDYSALIGALSATVVWSTIVSLVSDSISGGISAGAFVSRFIPGVLTTYVTVETVANVGVTAYEGVHRYGWDYMNAPGYTWCDPFSDSACGVASTARGILKGAETLVTDTLHRLNPANWF